MPRSRLEPARDPEVPRGSATAGPSGKQVRNQRAVKPGSNAPSPIPKVKFSARLARLLARIWAYLRGPGWAAASKALNRSESFLAKAQDWLVAALRRKPEPEPEPEPRETPGNLRFSDLDLDDPEDALHALRRASRVPPHRRHIDLEPDK